MKCLILSIAITVSALQQIAAQTTGNAYWHGIERTLHYRPEGNDFVLVNGTRKFNRALYGTHTAFRVEAGDLPEFAMYLPGMGGNCKMGIIIGKQSKWLSECDSIQTMYRPGAMLYQIKDRLLGNATVCITVLAQADAEGMIIKLTTSQLSSKTSLLVAYGGATGKKFSRDGDIGADPESSFYLQPDYCRDNLYTITANTFRLNYGATKSKEITGIFPEKTVLELADAEKQQSPLKLKESSPKTDAPAIVATISLAASDSCYFALQPTGTQNTTYNDLVTLYNKAETAREALVNRVVIETPDPWINPVAGALVTAADAIWEAPSYMHGAVAWRQRLPAWRGPYAADPLGWHDRAKEHFSSYALSQVTDSIPPGPVVADTALHLARQLEKMGTAMFSEGYIARNPNGDIRPHHYDMNLVYIDELLNHFNWTGDTAYVRQMWPVIKRHLAWEKRNFDADGDGLYDAYACIWASDALQYSGGGVTHATAYNYRGNTTASQLAKLMGEDATPYQQEAHKILTALNEKLWLKDKGWYAENKDLLGLQLVHPSAGLWTVYHAIDEGIASKEQAYQLLRYVDYHIPHIPVRAKGLPDSGYYVLSTTNWQPYTWSVNNVVLAENLHTALAYWQGGENDNAFKLWKSALIESMYLGASPGNFEQLSFYDAIRGELYRDFADPIGVAARTLVEGLFGVHPDVLNDHLLIKPGFPSQWKYAKLAIKDISIDYRQNGNHTSYTIIPSFNKPLNLELQLQPWKDGVTGVTVNNKRVQWHYMAAAGGPVIVIEAGKQSEYEIQVTWSGETAHPVIPLYLFVKPIAEVHTTNEEDNTQLPLAILNNSPQSRSGEVIINEGSPHTYKQTITIPAHDSLLVNIPLSATIKGTNHTTIRWKDGTTTQQDIIQWNIPAAKQQYETINLQPYFNDQVTQVFRNQYRSPRPTSTTLQIPWQGIGNWCYPLADANIDDSGLRATVAKTNNTVYLDNTIPFATPGATGARNILFTSRWNNYPVSGTIPLTGKASHAYLLMAGTTNHQQSQLTNAKITIQYTDGSTDSLLLNNPENWYPIEQDYYTDGYAFTTGAPKPYRLLLKTGGFMRIISKHTSIKGVTNEAIDGGAATVVDMPLQHDKELKNITLTTIANEVVAGLMGVTLVR